MRNMLVIETKIIATIAARTNKYIDLRDVHSAGINVERINMSHASHADSIKIIST